jgi:hypothetical protein
MMLEMSVPVKNHVLPAPTPPDLQRLETLFKKNRIEILDPLPE